MSTTEAEGAGHVSRRGFLRSAGLAGLGALAAGGLAELVGVNRAGASGLKQSRDAVPGHGPMYDNAPQTTPDVCTCYVYYTPYTSSHCRIMCPPTYNLFVQHYCGTTGNIICVAHKCSPFYQCV